MGNISTKKLNRAIFKKSPEELQEYLAFRRRGSKVPNKKAYDRNKSKREKEE